MFHSLPTPEPQFEAVEQRNPWAAVDLIAFGFFFLLMFLVLMQFSGLPVIYLVPLQGVFNIVLIGFTAVWVRLVRHESFTEYIHWRRNPTFPTTYLIAFGAALAVSVLIVSAFLPQNGQTPLEKFLTSPSVILMFAVFGVVAAPLLEEIIFRGFLFKVFWELGGSAIAILMTAVLFALLHSSQLAGNWGSVVLIFAVGCILSAIRHRSNSTIPSVIVHTSYNTMLFVLYGISWMVQRAFPN